MRSGGPSRLERQHHRATVSISFDCPFACGLWLVAVGTVADICDRIQVDSKIEEVRDKISKLEEYRTQLDGLTSIHTAHETAIAQARRWCDQHTKSDIVNIRRKSHLLMILYALGSR